MTTNVYPSVSSDAHSASSKQDITNISLSNMVEELKLRTKGADTILCHANMRVKRWTLSGDGNAIEV